MHTLIASNFRVVSLAIVICLAACASNTGVVPIGKSQYTIAKQQATGFPGLGNLRAEIIAEATAFCLSKGLEFELKKVQETQPPYILGNYPRSEILFTCTAPGSTPGQDRGKKNEESWDKAS
ncbi:MAG: hypothetical protein KDF54_05180 [Hydrogenophaga sp.]|nr:hypothetical protein [Hydrogenophaga sp.]